MMYAPAKKLSRVNADLQQAMAAGERIFEILDSHNEVDGTRRRGRRCRPSPAGSSSATCSSAYGGAETPATLDGVSFTVGAGQMLAIVGPQRRRQDDARQPDSALLRRDRRRDPRGRPRHARRDAGLAAVADRHRHAGDRAVRRHDRRQHRLRPAGRDARRDRGGGARRARPRVHRQAARPRLRHDDRRARSAAVGRAAAAALRSRGRSCAIRRS